ncbi:MAG: peptide chain release factor N(5)-glutamine methyltransferase [Acidobacteria bacterium]|nr:peptide chain release factor N(5)-glutamine methyltransferase [Acidobacteriota bacterium]
MTIHTRVAAGREQLRQARISPSESTLDARLLAQHALGWTTEQFLADGNGPEPDGFAERFGTLVARRATREPLAYITGRREFWGLDFEVTPAVLIPRPSTELIVGSVLELFRGASAPLAVADVCTGCGCVAVAIAHQRHAATVVATDISPEALEVAKRNAAWHGVGDRVTFMRADLLSGIDGPFDVIAANPPYVLDGAGPALQPEVRDYEPNVALFGGSDGLELITRLVAEAPSRLRSGGYLIFEFGLGQDVEIEELIENAPDFTLIELRRDLQGIARTAVAQRL